MQEWAAEMPRRMFLVRAGQGSIALAVLSITGCGPSPLASAAASESTPSSSAPPSSSARPSAPSSSSSPPSTGDAVTWHRANLGSVSAYVLARAGEAAIVDTGNPGSESAIAAALQAAGLGWDAVGHVILTHRHGDHVGSVDAVLAATNDAAVYAGAADIPSIGADRAITAVDDGDSVFGLTIVASPGHTAGHVCVLDDVGGLLVAGDALRTAGGTLAGSNPSFTEDEEQAKATVAKLGTLRFETLLVGHGEPILEGASTQVAALAAAG